MKNEFKLYMMMLGCLPKGRFTEQHDIFFGIAKNMRDLVPQIKAFWPEAKGRIHIDVWREVTAIDNYSIKVVKRGASLLSDQKLFFINLGGYKENEFEEYHYRIVTVADSLAQAVKQSKATSFFKHYGFKGARSHVDEKFGIDVDDIFAVTDMLPAVFTEEFELEITASENKPADILHIGYLKLDKLQ